MDVLFGAWVASHDYKTWESRQSKRVIRRAARPEIDLLQPLRQALASLKQTFALTEPSRACELNPAAC